MSQPTIRPAGYTSQPYTVADGVLTVVATPATLDALARQGIHHQVAPLPDGRERPTSGPQHRALAAAAEQGRVLRGGGRGKASVGTLTALARRGHLTLTAFPGSRRSNWAYGRITEAGRRELARLDAALAAAG